MSKFRFSYLLVLALAMILVFSSCNTVQSVYDEVQATQDAEAALAIEEEVGTATESDTVEEGEVALSAPDPNFVNAIGACRVKSDPLFAYPHATEDDWSLGPEDAAVTIIIYSDIQCPYCSLMDPEVNRLYETHKDEARLIFRHFPLDYHTHANISARAAEVIGEELGPEKFFAFISSMFAVQAEWSEMTEEAFLPYLLNKVQSEFGLDQDTFAKSIEAEEIYQRVLEDYEGGTAFVDGTPFVMMNGIPLRYFPRTVASFEDAYQFAKAFPSLVVDECPEMTINLDKQYLASFETTKGIFVMELYPKSAPFTVNSFVYLANLGYFDNSPFHRVIYDFVAQGGTGLTGEIGPGYEFDNEIDPNLSYDKAGVVGMANRGAGTNTSQFFITYSPQLALDGSYTIFAQVVEGMQVVEMLQAVDPQKDTNAVTPDLILHVTVTEK